jgi:hypothetical protein
MAALERDLDRVLADQADVLYEQLVGGEVLDARQAACRTAFAATFRAWAGPSELFTGVGAEVAVLPGDLHDLTDSVDVHGERKWIGVFQLSLPGKTTSGR